MARVSRILFLIALAFTFSGVVLSSVEVAAQDKKKKDDKTADKKDEKKDDKATDKKDDKAGDKKDDKDKKEEKKKEDFKPDAPQQEFKYVEKDKKDEKERTFWVYSVAFGPDGKTVAAAYRNHSVKIWDLGSKKDIQTLKGPAKDAKGLADYRSVVYAGNQVFVGTGKWNTEKKIREGEIRVWDAKSGKAGKSIAAHMQDVESLGVSKDGKFLASASEDNTVQIWNLADSKSSQTIKGHTDFVTSVAFSADGKQVVTTSKDKTVRVWDVEGAKEVALFKVEREVEIKDAKGKVTKQKELGREFTRAVFTSDGKKIITGNLDGVIKIYDVADKKEVKELKAHEGVWSLALSPDGSKFATGGYDGTIKIWNANDGMELRTIKAHLGAMPNVGGNVTSIAYSPDGQRLVSGGVDGTVKIWSVK